MERLPNAEKAVIPEAKLAGYVLNAEKDPGKAYAFYKVLAYTPENAGDLAMEILRAVTCASAVCRGDNGFGMVYEAPLLLRGANGRTAAALSGWIVKYGEDAPSLTTVYITDRRGLHDPAIQPREAENRRNGQRG